MQFFGNRLLSLLVFSSLAISTSLQAQGRRNAEAMGDLVPDVNALDARIEKSYLFKFMRERHLSKVPGTPANLTRELVYAGYDPVRMKGSRGRSAQRPCTNENSPRHVFASYQSQVLSNVRNPIGFENYANLDGSDYVGRLFFAQVEDCDEMEIISWNFSTGKFDFFIVEDASTPQSKLYEVTMREACTSCHSSGGPVWTRLPAVEFATHDPLRFFRVDQRPFDFATPPTLYAKDGMLLTKELTPRVNNSSFAFGNSSISGNRLKQANEVLRRLCRQRDDCKRMILAMAMANVRQSTVIRNKTLGLSDPSDIMSLNPQAVMDALNVDSVPEFFRDRRYLRLIREVWSANNFARTSDLLPDLEDVTTGGVSFPEADPSSPRDVAIAVSRDLAPAYLYDISFEGLGFETKHINQFRAYDPDLLVSMFVEGRSLPEIDAEVQALIRTWPPEADAVAALADRWLAQGENTYRDTPAEAAVNSTDKDAKNLFNAYCGVCHQGPRAPAGLSIASLALDDLRIWNGQNDQRVINALASGAMPPRGMPRPSEDELLRMQQALSGNSSRQYVNHFRVRVAESDAVQFSYIAEDPQIAPDSSMYMDTCSGDKVSTHRPNAFLATQFANGKSAFALENFPEYMVGNLTQVIGFSRRLRADHHDSNEHHHYSNHNSHYNHDNSHNGNRHHRGECGLIGVTRNGNLQSLRYDLDLKRHVSVRLAVTTPQNGFLYVAQGYHPGVAPELADVGYLFAIGRDRRLYKLNVTSSGRPAVSVTPVNVSNGGAFTWSRISHVSKHKVILENVDGALIEGLVNHDGSAIDISPGHHGPVSNRDSSQELLGLFAPSLLDRYSYVVIPSGRSIVRKTSPNKLSLAAPLRTNVQGNELVISKDSHIELLPDGVRLDLGLSANHNQRQEFGISFSVWSSKYGRVSSFQVDPVVFEGGSVRMTFDLNRDVAQEILEFRDTGDLSLVVSQVW